MSNILAVLLVAAVIKATTGHDMAAMVGDGLTSLCVGAAVLLDAVRVTWAVLKVQNI